MLKITPTVFWMMEIRDFHLAYKAYEKTVEVDQRLQLENTRKIAYFCAAHFFGKGETKTIQKWWPFPWDEETVKEIPYLEVEERKKVLESFGKKAWIPKHWNDEQASC